MTLPILYSFRRCPYAIRARLAIKASGIRVELREVVLRDKPEAMIRVSAKATVPVLVKPDGQVIDESFDIMQWALAQNDPGNWLPDQPQASDEMMLLVTSCDGVFKQALDRYKYAERYPQQTAADYRQQAEPFLTQLELQLKKSAFLLADQATCVDMAILPFIRQFAFVDKTWFDESSYDGIKRWLEDFLQSQLFAAVMLKYTPWKQATAGIEF